MKRSTLITLAVLLVVAGAIVVALVREASSGPSFRAADYGSLEECLRAIPSEWVEGSIERSGAETACRYTHAPAAPARP